MASQTETRGYLPGTTPPGVMPVAATDPHFAGMSFDTDVAAMDDRDLIAEVVRLRQAIRLHRDTPDREPSDDADLYSVLPEHGCKRKRKARR